MVLRMVVRFPINLLKSSFGIFATDNPRLAWGKFCTQLRLDKWYDVIGESTVANAVIDRQVHTSYRIELSGESMRKKEKRVILISF